MAASEVLLVITPEPTSMTDAYALLKVLFLNNYKGEIKIIVNQCKDKDQAMKEYSKFSGAVKKFLNKDVKDDMFNLREANSNVLLADEKNDKSENKTDISQSDRLFDLMQNLICSVDKVSAEIHEINSRLKSGNNVLVSGEQNKINNNVCNNASGIFLDYEEFIQEKENMVRGNNG